MPNDTRSQDRVSSWIKQQEETREPTDLSVVVPAYNEQWRIPTTLIDMIDYLDNSDRSYEILVVDDGSSDQTSEVVKKFLKLRPQVKLIRVPKNYGKGHAVRTGMLNAHGELVLFADADGSTPFEEIERLETALKENKALVAIGSRALQSEDTSIKTRWYRKYLGRMFNFCVNLFILPSYADTQCGFKLFTADACQFLFSLQQSDGFSFDVEILFLADKAGIPVQEVPINWENAPGSKVNLVFDSMRMLRDIFVFRIRHRKISPAEFSNFLNNSSS